ncbi:MAG: hypothetical protein RLY90_232, partial [Pseudomonadota bacterium]
MDQIKRQLLLATLLAPVGCAIQPLAPIQNTPLPTPPDPPSPIRPVEIGQTWSYKKFNYYNSALVDRVIETVKSIKTEIEIERLSLTNGALPSEIQTQWGWVKQDPYWETLQTYDDALPIWLDPLDVGVTQLMSTHYQSENNSFKHWINLQTTVVAREKVTL